MPWMFTGGIEADVTVTRLAAEEFYLVTGAGFGRHDIAIIARHAPDDRSVAVLAAVTTRR